MGPRIDTTAAYDDVRKRMTTLAREALVTDPDLGSRPVPACPNWSVADLFAHTAGAAADVAEMRLDGVGSDAWTDAQVSARRGRTVDELLDEWEARQTDMVQALSEVGVPTQALFDTVSHEHDLRGVLDTPGHRDDPALLASLSWDLAGFGNLLVAAGHPTLAIEVGGRRKVLGTGDAAGTLRAEPFELLRALSGRRSVVQIRAMDWSTDPEPWLAAFTFGPFTPRPDDLVE